MEETKRYVVKLKESVNAYPMYFGHSNSLDYAKRVAKKLVSEKSFGFVAFVYDWEEKAVVYRIYSE